MYLKIMSYFTVFLLSSIFLEVTAAGPRCFECTRIPFPRDCDHVRVCGEHEACYTKQIVSDSGHVYYDTGCLDKLTFLWCEPEITSCLTESSDLCTGNSEVSFGPNFLGDTFRAADRDAPFLEIFLDHKITSLYHNMTKLETLSRAYHVVKENSVTREAVERQIYPLQTEDQYASLVLRGSNSPEQCDKVSTCGRDQHCIIQPFTGVGGDLLFKSGCTHSCPTEATAVGTIVGKRDTKCFGCCDDDFCNSNCSAVSKHGLVTPTKASHQETTSRGHSVASTKSTSVFKTTQPLTAPVTPGSAPTGIIDRSALCKQLNNEYTYLSDYDHCVKIYHNTKLTWFQSRDRCKNDSGNLMTFHNKKEEGYFETLTEQPTSEWDSKRYWVGASDLGHEGQWLWSDNTPVDKTYFYPNEPNNGASRHEEDCGATGFINRTFLLNDDVCENQYHFICEINLTAVTSITTTQGYPRCRNSHYTYSPNQGACFHVYDDRDVTMQQARIVCQKEHADLLQLKDRNSEQSFINYGFIDRDNNNRRYWLGARKHSDGHFYWLNGNRLGDSYIWAPGEPNNFQNAEECLDFTWFAANEELHTPATFALNDDNCGRNYFFICEETRGY